MNDVIGFLKAAGINRAMRLTDAVGKRVMRGSPVTPEIMGSMMRENVKVMKRTDALGISSMDVGRTHKRMLELPNKDPQFRKDVIDVMEDPKAPGSLKKLKGALSKGMPSPFRAFVDLGEGDPAKVEKVRSAVASVTDPSRPGPVRGLAAIRGYIDPVSKNVERAARRVRGSKAKRRVKEIETRMMEGTDGMDYHGIERGHRMVPKTPTWEPPPPPKKRVGISDTIEEFDVDASARSLSQALNRAQRRS